MTKHISATPKRPRLARPKIKTFSSKEIEQIGKIQGLADRLKALEEKVSALEIDHFDHLR